MRLDCFIAHRLRRVSRALAQQIIAKGGVALRPPRSAKAARKVYQGDVVIITQHLPTENLSYDQVQHLYIGPRLIALNKPAGMLVHPTATAHLNCITTYVAQQGWHDAAIVHRLDRESSGVLILARGTHNARFLGRLFASEGTVKIYLAIVNDPQSLLCPARAFSILWPIGPCPHAKLKSITMGPGAWPASTHCLCLARHQNRALLALRIEHGRQHQIRVHLALSGFPVLGDKLYLHGEDFYRDWVDGKQDHQALSAPRHMLHAFQLRLFDGDQQHHFCAPIPEDFRHAWSSEDHTAPIEHHLAGLEHHPLVKDTIPPRQDDCLMAPFVGLT